MTSHGCLLVCWFEECILIPRGWVGRDIPVPYHYCYMPLPLLVLVVVVYQTPPWIYKSAGCRHRSKRAQANMALTLPFRYDFFSYSVRRGHYKARVSSV